MLGAATCGLGSLLGPLTFTISVPPVTEPPVSPGPGLPAPVAPGPALPAPPPSTTSGAIPVGGALPALVPAAGSAPAGGAGVPGGILAAGAATVTGLLGVDGRPGDPVTIAGTGLGTRPGRVLVGGRRAVVAGWSPTRAVVLLPDLPAGAAAVRIVVAGRTVLAPDILVRSAPGPAADPEPHRAPGRPRRVRLRRDAVRRP